MAHRAGRTIVAGVELAYEDRGNGEPVVLIHPGHFADWLKPLLDEPALTARHRVISYDRAGCGRSGPLTGQVSLATHASHCRSLIEYLGIDRAHIVAQSSGANVALQLALDAPGTVQSLALLEPALMSVPSAATSRAFVATAVSLHRAGDMSGAVDTFLQGVCGPGYRAVLDRELPDGFAQYVADAAMFFDHELPALQQWSFTREDASRITQPVLAVIGAKSAVSHPIWRERHDLLLSWLPNAEPFVLPDATHLLQIENSREMAEGLAAFFARHPMSMR